MPDLDLMHMALSAPILAAEQDADFVRIDAVWRLPHDGGMPRLYCATELWPDSYVGRIAQQTHTIAALETQLGTAHAEIATLRQTLDRLLDAALAEPIDPAPAPPQAAPEPPDLPCPQGCGEAGLKNQKAVNLHVQRAHLGMQARPRSASTADPAPTAPTPATLPADDPAWSCAACGKRPGLDGAFARSVTRPELCMRCAAQANSVRPAAHDLAQAA